MGNRQEQYKNKVRVGAYKKVKERQTQKRGDKVVITITNIMEIIEEVIEDVFREYDVLSGRECDCSPDMDLVKKVSLEEGMNMNTEEILRLCSKSAAASKGQYD